MEKQQQGRGGAPVNGFTYRKTYRLDKKFSVEISRSMNSANVSWSPHMPRGQKLRSLWPDYQKALHAFLDEFNPGHSYLVVDILERNPAQ
jgi:hypothetical protein